MGSASRWHTLRQWIGKEHGEEERDRVGEEKGEKKKLLSGLPAVVRALPTLIRFSRFFFFFFCALHSLLSTPSLSLCLSPILCLSLALCESNAEHAYLNKHHLLLCQTFFLFVAVFVYLFVYVFSLTVSTILFDYEQFHCPPSCVHM